jgi:DNA-binding response OmpR family regulator
MSVSNSTILLIDDEPNLIIGLSAIMERAGYQMLTANNGDDGLRLAQEHKPDLIICDVMMPSPDGFEFRKLLSKLPDLATVPFIFLTARVAQDDKVYGLERGADDYITKPFNREELLARVKAVLRRGELGRRKGRSEVESQLDLLRQEIAQNVSHKLRTPVAVVLSTLDATLKDKFEGKPKDRQWFIQAALDNAYQLHYLIEDLITLSDINRGAINSEREELNLAFDFHYPVEQRLKKWHVFNRCVRIAVEPELTITAPPAGFQQAVVHLVDNACKFRARGGRIEIELAANGTGGCIFTVGNEGAPVPPELREKVFEKYYQINQNNHRRHVGLGVGLTIARAFARELGGDVIIPDAGSKCVVQMILPPEEPH